MIPFEIRWIDLVDIALVAILVYYMLYWLQGTRAASLIRGLFLILLLYILGRFLGLYTINWLFDKFAAVIAVMLAVLFQPELRRTLERLGRGRFVGKVYFSSVSHHIVRAIEQLSAARIGALIIIERNTGLTEYLESGVPIDAQLSAEILLSIFNPKSPLHDGAVIIQGERVMAASCLLPISESRLLDKRLGTRHRAAVGISEISDALAIAVSEKTGSISIAENGFLNRYLTKESLEEKLLSLYKIEKEKPEVLPWKKARK